MPSLWFWAGLVCAALAGSVLVGAHGAVAGCMIYVSINALVLSVLAEMKLL